MRADLADAGLPEHDAAGNKLVFHSFRHTTACGACCVRSDRRGSDLRQRPIRALRICATRIFVRRCRSPCLPGNRGNENGRTKKGLDQRFGGRSSGPTRGRVPAASGMHAGGGREPLSPSASGSAGVRPGGFIGRADRPPKQNPKNERPLCRTAWNGGGLGARSRRMGPSWPAASGGRGWRRCRRRRSPGGHRRRGPSSPGAGAGPACRSNRRRRGPIDMGG